MTQHVMGHNFIMFHVINIQNYVTKNILICEQFSSFNIQLSKTCFGEVKNTTHYV